MEPYYPTMARPLDALFASWLSSSPPSTVGYHLRCGMSFPVPAEARHGTGPDWEARAVAAVVRECYRLGLRRPALEEVEVVTLSVLPEPPEEDRRPSPPLAPGPRDRWERAVRVLSEAAHRIVRHGPASGSAGGEVLHAGGTLRTEAAGLPLEARVDLIWRRPDGALEAVLVVEEPWEDAGEPAAAGDDWRCVLTAAVVSRLYGESPDLHTVWAAEGAARVDALAAEAVEEKLRCLRDALEIARGFGGLRPGEESALYGFGPWPSGEARRDGSRSRRSRKRRPRPS
jgi:hypothetical protein